MLCLTREMSLIASPLQAHITMRLLKALIKAGAAITLAMVCMVLPLYEWAPVWFLRIQVPLTGLVLVCYLGKLLYDTVFYDHYWP